MAEPIHPAVVSEAVRLIRKATARIINDQPQTESMSPERKRWTETWSMLWTAAALLDQSGLNDEDAADVAEVIANLQAQGSATHADQP